MTTAAATIPTDLIDLDHAVHRLELKADGIAMAQVRAAERAGHLYEFRKDFFGPPGLATADPYRLLTEAIRAYLRLPEAAGLVVGGRTAARLHRLLPAMAPEHASYQRDDAIEFRTHAAQARGFSRAAAGCTLDARPRVTVRVDGIEVTSVARTLVDLLAGSRWRSPDDFVVVGDRALREDLVTVADLEDEIRQLPVTQQSRLRTALADLNPGARTAAESRSRLLLTSMGLPAPELHMDIVDTDGTVVASPPFVWPAYRVAGFCDEVDDYCDLYRRVEDRPPRSDPQVPECAARTSLDDRLTRLGYRVFRWSGGRIDRHPCDPCNLRRALQTPLGPPLEEQFCW
ncbi:hypothetical protein [Gordonia caeni]|uniref:Uncharacterized protein n=1 Tax=Gordonia caeni TaxID=1007097 RepID=A0ABP7PHD0_9ACTN